MEFNKHAIEGKWNELKGEIRKAWGRLTDDELEATKGDAQSIGGLIQQKYGKEQADWQSKFDSIYDKFKEKKDEKVEQVKDGLRN